MKSKRKLETNEFDENLWQMVTHRYAEDFELFGYDTGFGLTASELD